MIRRPVRCWSQPGCAPGHAGPKHWREKRREVDLYDVKSDALAALAAMGAPAEGVQVSADPRAGTIRVAPRPCGSGRSPRRLRRVAPGRHRRARRRGRRSSASRSFSTRCPSRARTRQAAGSLVGVPADRARLRFRRRPATAGGDTCCALHAGSTGSSLRDPALRHLPGSRVARRQEVARHHRRIATARAHLDRRRDRGLFAAPDRPGREGNRRAVCAAKTISRRLSQTGRRQTERCRSAGGRPATRSATILPVIGAAVIPT